MTGGEIRESLETAGVRPSKELGQNFLCDAEVARWIVDQLEPQAGDTVVEVGPGTGALSRHLVGRVERLILVEFDRRLAAWLTEHFRDEPGVEVHHADGARFDTRMLWKHRPVKFLGNLPYSAGGAIMKNFFSRPHPLERAVVMLQKEVIDRLCAVPRTKAYGVLSLKIQSEWRVTPLRTVPPEAFHPRPRIDSSVALLEPRPQPPEPYDGRRFDELVRRGFSQRRKQLRKHMPESPGWEEVAETVGISPQARAEELSLDEWMSLARVYDDHPLKGNPQQGDEIFDVVDEGNLVIGTATRAEVHARGLLHRAVHVFAINRKRELLLQRRSHLKDRHPGVWDSSVSGHLDAGEDYPQAAVREMAEEMGIAEAEPEEIARIEACEATGWEHIRLFVIRWDGTPRFPAAEVEAVMWLAADEIDAWLTARPADFASGFRICWEAARGRA